MQHQFLVPLNLILFYLLNFSEEILNLTFAMTLVFGKKKLRDVFQPIQQILKDINITQNLHFVTGQSLIACMVVLNFSFNIVQIKMKAVKAMVKKSISFVMKVKPA